MKKLGIDMIEAERRRQIEQEKYDHGHDDRHANQELQRAAECYFHSGNQFIAGFKSFRPPESWPWAKRYWKPTNAVRDFVKAGALWLAEIDRMKRLDPDEQFPSNIESLRNRVKTCARKIDERN